MVHHDSPITQLESDVGTPLDKAPVLSADSARLDHAATGGHPALICMEGRGRRVAETSTCTKASRAAMALPHGAVLS
jgi:hypothetical protein